MGNLLLSLKQGQLNLDLKLFSLLPRILRPACGPSGCVHVGGEAVEEAQFQSETPETAVEVGACWNARPLDFSDTGGGEHKMPPGCGSKVQADLPSTEFRRLKTPAHR